MGLLGTGVHRRQSPVMTRRMNWSNSGTVKAVAPCSGLQAIPLAIRLLLVSPSDVTVLPRAAAISPDR